jgi:hypothetical protein
MAALGQLFSGSPELLVSGMLWFCKNRKDARPAGESLQAGKSPKPLAIEISQVEITSII